ncbi:unnamed protein product [Protopolystoma xenopodis]|uniref:Uncharacterized protein n=1 Tax=Protopolystoma xenopodis TaxID=117903 RepID=A0A3S5APQ7_9PLAT|nr:unnamed protein product [Protopolystoma xenopodis]
MLESTGLHEAFSTYASSLSLAHMLASLLHSWGFDPILDAALTSRIGLKPIIRSDSCDEQSAMHSAPSNDFLSTLQHPKSALNCTSLLSLGRLSRHGCMALRMPGKYLSPFVSI